MPRMKFLGIFRAVALLCLAFGITGQLISCKPAPAPVSLKDLFDFIDKLSHTPMVKRKVCENLNRKVATFCNYADKFWKDLDGTSSEGYISDLFESVSAIRGLIVTRTDEYGHYSDVTLSLVDAGLYEDIVAKWLPHIYSALYYVYFNGSKKDCGSIKGGQWGDLRCNELGNNQYLGKWLSDQIDSKFPRQLIQRGFTSGELGSTTGQDVADRIKSAVNHDTGGSLQNALYGMLFLGMWNDAKTGHALRFLHEFAINVLNDKFQTHSATKYTAGGFDSLKVICQKLKERLDVFVGTTAKHFYGVSSKPTQHYPDLIKIEAFDAYVDWMEKHIVSIIGSLNSMARDALKWKIQNIVDATTAGPFKYGFVFKDGLNEDTFDTTIKAYSTDLINDGNLLIKLLAELRKLKMVERHKPANVQIDGPPESTSADVPTGTVHTQPGDSQGFDETPEPEEPTESSEKKSSAAIASSVACFSMLGLLVSMI